MDLEKYRALARQKAKENKKFFQKLKSVKPKILDQIHQLHAEVIACTDCLKCGNCYSTNDLLLTDKDIGRISKRFRIKPSEFTENYVIVDDDKNCILSKLPQLPFG